MKTFYCAVGILFVSVFIIGKINKVDGSDSSSDCICTADYTPVCGSNDATTVTYTNACRLECAKKKDSKWHLLYNGACKNGTAAPTHAHGGKSGSGKQFGCVFETIGVVAITFALHG